MVEIPETCTNCGAPQVSPEDSGVTDDGIEYECGTRYWPGAGVAWGKCRDPENYTTPTY